jgi:hypothetical protein
MRGMFYVVIKLNSCSTILVSFFLSFLPSYSDIYLLTVDAEGYCCNWAHSMTHTRQDSSGRGIGPSQRPLPDNVQHLTRDTHIHAADGIRTRNPSERAAADLRLRLCPACQRPACTRVSRPLTWADKHVCKWGCPASQRVESERAKRTLWLVAATQLFCPLLPGRSCRRQR